MTDAASAAQIAAVRTSLDHLERAMERAHSDRVQTDKKIDDIRERVVRLESGSAQTSDLPRRVAHTELENAVQDAVRIERAEVLGDIRRVIFSAIGAVAALVGVASSIVIWATNGG